MPARAALLAVLLLLGAPAAATAGPARDLLPSAAVFGDGWRTVLVAERKGSEVQRLDGEEVPRGLVRGAAFRQVRRARPLPGGGRPEGTAEVVLHRTADGAARRFAFREEVLLRASDRTVPSLPSLGQDRVATALTYDRQGERWCALGALVLDGRAHLEVSLGQPLRSGCPKGAALRAALTRAHRELP